MLHKKRSRIQVGGLRQWDSGSGGDMGLVAKVGKWRSGTAEKRAGSETG